MREIEIEAAGRALPDIVRQVREGAEAVLLEKGRAMARIIATDETISGTRGPRPLGLGAGDPHISYPENFNDPLPDDLLDAFEGKP